VRAATGEIVTDEDLGGDWSTRARPVSSITSLRMTPTPFRLFARSCRRSPEERTPLDVQANEEPTVDPNDLYGVVPCDTRTPYDVREVIARLVDASLFHEFKTEYGTTLVTGSPIFGDTRSGSSPTTACCSRSRR